MIQESSLVPIRAEYIVFPPFTKLRKLKRSPGGDFASKLCQTKDVCLLKKSAIRNSNDADDLLQDIFLKVYINLNDYDADLPFSSWLYRIAHNETVSFFRKKNVRPVSIASEEANRLFENISDGIDFTESVNAKINADLLRKALLELEKQYRDVLILKFLEEKSYNEIADILTIPIGTVGTLISRGKKQLKDILMQKNINL